MAAVSQIFSALARVETGLKCVTRQGHDSTTIDMPAAMGGDDSYAIPGEFVTVSGTV